MKQYKTIDKMRSVAKEYRENNESIALVPTMGCLHAGHEALIDEAKNKADRVIVTSFVNPTQFGPNERPERYPVDIENDILICKNKKADVLFTPNAKEIYPVDFSTYITENSLSKKLGGVSRPQLFKGHTTIINILYNIIHPDYIVLGTKEIQQTAIIKKMARDLHMSVEVVECPIVREADELAASTYNRFLEGSQRTEAAKIPEALNKAKRMVNEGVRAVERIVAELTHHFASSLKIRVNYISLVDPKTMEPVGVIKPGETLLTVNVWVDQIRLNDNIML